MSEKPSNCRNRLRDEGKPYPKSGCGHCSNGGLMGCPFDRPTPPASQESVIAPGMYQDTEGKVPARIGDQVGLYVQPDPFARRESAGEAVLPRITAEDWSFLHYNPNTDDVVEWVRNYARLHAATLTAELAEARAEVEKETAQSKHLAEAMSRKIQELITAENQCSYYKGQYTRAEQVRKEACEANVKAQAKTLWLEDELAEARAQRDKWKREATENMDIARDVIAERDSLRDECERLREGFRRVSAGLRTAGASLPAPENKGTIESAMQTGLSIALLLVEEELAALSASGREGE